MGMCAGWRQALEAAGLTSVVATNVTPLFVECLVAEAAKLEAVKDSFVAEFSLADFDYLMDGWKAKMVRCEAGLQTWGLFEGVKAPVA
jgi:phosphoethanolamine N-methyltransferase